MKYSECRIRGVELNGHEVKTKPPLCRAILQRGGFLVKGITLKS